MEQYLENIYTDPKNPGSYGGVDRLYRQVKADGKYNLSRDDIVKWLTSRDEYTIHKNIRRNFKRNRIYTSGIDDLWEADLMSVENLAKYNNKIRFLLVMIDVFSKFLTVIPLKNKSGPEVLRGLKLAFRKGKDTDSSPGRSPDKLRTDNGREFLNHHVKKYLKSKNIYLFTTNDSAQKAAVAERAIKTVRQRLGRWMTYHQSNSYIKALKDIVNSYNHSYHKSIKTTPLQVTKLNEPEIWQTLYGKETPSNKKLKLKPGQLVRISVASGLFDKEFNERYSRELFKIHRIINRNPPVYKLVDLKNPPEEIKGTFYEQEVTPVTKTEDALYKIEKILKTRKKNNKKQYLVRWQGYSSDFDQWIDAKDLKNLKQ